MTPQQVVDQARQFRVMLVTGPQRSGTTFTGKALAADLGWKYRDETEFGVSRRDAWAALVARERQAVIQCPTMMKYVHDVADDVLVVVMRRPVPEIVASQRRIRWGWKADELARYGLTDGVISQVKYRWWDAHKREGPAHWVELEYAAMRSHPMWVPAELRAMFDPKQTEVTDG